MILFGGSCNLLKEKLDSYKNGPGLLGPSLLILSLLSLSLSKPIFPQSDKEDRIAFSILELFSQDGPVNSGT